MIRLPNLRGSVLAICAFPHVNLVVAPVQASKRRQGHDSSLGHHAKADSENGEGSGHQQNGAAAAGRHGGRSKARDDGVRGHGCNANRSMRISRFNRPLYWQTGIMQQHSVDRGVATNRNRQSCISDSSSSPARFIVLRTSLNNHHVDDTGGRVPVQVAKSHGRHRGAALLDIRAASQKPRPATFDFLSLRVTSMWSRSTHP